MKNLFPNNFFKQNPLMKTSTAQIAYFSSQTMFNERLHDTMFEIAKEHGIPEFRLQQIEKEKEIIPRLETGEEFVRFVRKGYDIINRELLSERALAMQNEFIPNLLKRFQTSSQDSVIETTFYILTRSEQTYVDQVFAMYSDIRDPYAQSMACLIFGIRNQENTVPLLLAEYERLKHEYPDESYNQGPLLAIYILAGKA